MQLGTDDPVWYVAYGSNLLGSRFLCYLAGGRPPGAQRTYVGARDRTSPRRDLAVPVPGGLVFAGDSTVWGGAIAFYDPAAADMVTARAYLISFGQFSDVVAQEARRPVGADLLLGTTGLPGRWPAPSGVYETVLHVGDHEGFPMLTITSLQDLVPAPPAAPYLRTILGGLEEFSDLTNAESVDYLLRAPGVSLVWSRDELLGLRSSSA